MAPKGRRNSCFLYGKAKTPRKIFARAGLVSRTVAHCVIKHDGGLEDDRILVANLVEFGCAAPLGCRQHRAPFPHGPRACLVRLIATKFSSF